MFAKIFEQIFDSSIAEDWQVRHVFEDLLKLCDREGIVDRTPESIARRTNVPLEIVTRALSILEAADPNSRNPEHEGRRIIRISGHRNWGWRIVNYEHYRRITCEDERRARNLEAVQRYREKKTAELVSHYPVASTQVANIQRPLHAPDNSEIPVKPDTAQKPYVVQIRQLREQLSRGGPPPAPLGTNKLSASQKHLADRMETALGQQWVNDAGKWIGRIRMNLGKSNRIIAELENAVKEQRILTTPAQFAEDTWGRFAG